MITNCRKNRLGTVDFDGKFLKMRKPQEFVVYPMQDSGTQIKVQSATRIGLIDLENGDVLMSTPKAGGACIVDLRDDFRKFTLPQEDVQTLRQWVKSTGSPAAGGSVRIYTDNTGAMAL